MRINTKIIVDSMCELNETLKAKFNAIIVPATLIFDNKEYIDDDSITCEEVIKNMKLSNKVTTSCPSPQKYIEAFKDVNAGYCVTISDKLSGSYNSANTALNILTNNNIYIFNSNSASAGEVLIAKKIYESLEEGLNKLEIIRKVENFIKEMKTIFALDNVTHFVKSGRLSNITGKIISTLGIRPIMESNGNGSPKLISHARGEKNLINKILNEIKKSKRKTVNETLIITHCLNENLAFNLSELAKNIFKFKEIIILPTKGVTSLFAGEKGICIAF